jgi:hypothetical protein
LARSSGRPGRRGPGRRAAGPEAADTAPGLATGVAPAPSLAAATLPRLWQGIGYRPLTAYEPARPLFDYVAVPWPAPGAPDLGWGAFALDAGGVVADAGGVVADARGERLVGAVLAERDGGSLLLHGPVVVRDEGAVDVAAQLVAAVLDHALALGAGTVFARPLGLDRVWIRAGFIPVPESSLPSALAGQPGSGDGLYAWRGGSALWTLRQSAGDDA